jgi:hypothetical protein
LLHQSDVSRAKSLQLAIAEGPSATYRLLSRVRSDNLTKLGVA